MSEISATALTAADCKRLPIVDVTPSGRVEIVDGYHRIAGLIASGESVIECLTCDDEDLVQSRQNVTNNRAAASDPEDRTSAVGGSG